MSSDLMMQLLKSAADQGDVQAQYELGMCDYNDEDGRKDVAEAPLNTTS